MKLADTWRRWRRSIRLRLVTLFLLLAVASTGVFVVADKILPIYGRAILGELLTTFDVKGKAGHGRRLKVIHSISPADARELVKQALDEGSKEVKIVAIECLGDSDDDLSFLLEQASARAKDVRAAAFLSLSRLKSAEAKALLMKTLDTKAHIFEAGS